MNFSLIENLGSIINDNSKLREFSLNSNKLLKVGHMNVQSLNPSFRSSKFDEFKSLVNDSLRDVIAISETWLKPHISDYSMNIHDYLLIKNDRLDMRGGGVALFIRKGISAREVYRYSNPSTYEALFVEICIRGDNVIVGVVYVPHGNLEGIDIVLGDISARYKDIVILGYYNMDMFSPSKACRIRDLCHSCGLSYFHNRLPTHFDMRYNSTSLIDFAIVSDIDFVKSSRQFVTPSISHHSFIYLSFEVSVKVTETSAYVKDYTKINLDSIYDFMTEEILETLNRTNNVDVQLDIFNRLLFNMHDNVSVRKIEYRDNTYFMDLPDVRSACRVRHLSFKAFVENRSSETWRTYCRYRNRVKSILRKHKKRYWTERFSSRDKRYIWDAINKRLCGRARQATEQFDSNSLNQYFVSQQTMILDRVPHFESFPDTGFSFRCVDAIELRNAFCFIKSNSYGADRLPLKFLRIIYPFIEPFLLTIVNTILTTSVYPQKWKCSRVVPIGKKRVVNSVEDFRPISIQCTLSKVVEIILKGQIVEHLDSNSLLSDRHFGFTPGRSTKLIYSYLINREQFVCVGKRESLVEKCTSGVPQGSVLGPLLFLIYVNDFVEFIDTSNCSVYPFADDINLVARVTGNGFDYGDTRNDILPLDAFDKLQSSSSNGVEEKSEMFASRYLDRPLMMAQTHRLHRRHSIGAYDECCRKGCTINEMTAYCYVP
ncbi:uncharacterized protein LOC142235689 [Haematobia irritans]|uniref:uncharacterized protein LOC142235689 n=1 Tax=Haematobia irritans TaxID=7368 RepID=UPI003F502337